MSVLLWEDPQVPALLTAALVVVLAAAAAVGEPLLAAGVAAVQAVFTLGGVRPAAVPAAPAAAWLALVVAVGASAWMAFGNSDGMWPLAALLGPALVVAVLIQLARRDGRDAMTRSLSLTVAACALALLPVAWLALRATDDGLYTVWLGLIGVGVAGLAELLPAPVAARRTAAVLLAGALAAGVAIAIGDVAASVPAVGGVVVATFAALTAVASMAAVDRVAAEGGDSSARLVPLRVTLPIVVAAPVAYVLGRILVG